MAVRKSRIKQIVGELLEKHRVKRGPVPVEKIAHALDIEINLDEVDDDLSGFLFRDKKANRTVIGANKAHHPNRQRFTIAHELGHYLLHEGETVHLDNHRGAYTVNRRDAKSATGDDNNEREANLFAAELLMPEQFLEEDLRNKDFDLLSGDNQLDTLAKKYGVSVQALTFRLANLGYIEQ